MPGVRASSHWGLLAAGLLAASFLPQSTASPDGGTAGTATSQSSAAGVTYREGTALAAAPAPLQVASVDISAAQVVAAGGTRGPVTESLPDGRLLLGGGRDGDMLMVWNPGDGQVTPVGAIISASQRLPDARFAPNDIELMWVRGDRARLFVSFPEYVASRNCVRVAVNRVDISVAARPTILAMAGVLRTSPCVPVNAIQHASGRLARINSFASYLTVGDLGYPRINSRRNRGQLGSVLRIAEGKKAKRISQGHRNGQGLLIDSSGNLWETEHGPQGGDELNLIRRGRDYGWPFVTLGQPYGSTDYVMPRRTGTHRGYTKPRTAWVPSVATSEIVQVSRAWPGWQGTAGPDLLMGTLKDQALWRIRVTRGERVVQRQRIPIGHRVRDLEVRPNGSIAATTDDGSLLLISAG